MLNNSIFYCINDLHINWFILGTKRVPVYVNNILAWNFTKKNLCIRWSPEFELSLTIFLIKSHGSITFLIWLSIKLEIN